MTPPDDETTREQPKPNGLGISQSVVSLAAAPTPTPTASPTAEPAAAAQVEAASADSTPAEPTPAAKAPDSAVEAKAKSPDRSIDDAEASSFEFSADVISTHAPILDVNELIAQLKRSDDSTNGAS